MTLFSDSQYVVNGIAKGWARNWRAKGWQRSGKTVPNWDLWRQLLELSEHHRSACNGLRGMPVTPRTNDATNWPCAPQPTRTWQSTSVMNSLRCRHRARIAEGSSG